jgi:hypothetical protein
MLFSKITDAEKQALDSIAAALSINSTWLYQLIDFESGWNPAAKNPYSGARGLIQFVNSTARDMGYLSADDLYEKNPDRIKQLQNPVFLYLKKYAPFPTLQSLLMAVFYPKYRNVEPDTLFPQYVLASNPGIKTPADYIKRVFPDYKPLAIGGALLVAAVFFVLITSQRGV